MKTVAVAFHGVERFEVPDDKVEEFMEEHGKLYKRLMKQFNIQSGDIDIDETWCEEDEAMKKAPEVKETTSEQKTTVADIINDILENDFSDEELNIKAQQISNIIK